jgi:hypothetical protein
MNGEDRVKRNIIRWSLVLLAALVVSCDSGSRAKLAKETERERYLSEADPDLKKVRDEITAEVDRLDRKISEIRNQEPLLKRAEAKGLLKEVSRKALDCRSRLERQLLDIDAEVQRSLAPRDGMIALWLVNVGEKAGRGGVDVLKESASVLRETQSVLDDLRKYTAGIERSYPSGLKTNEGDRRDRTNLVPQGVVLPKEASERRIQVEMGGRLRVIHVPQGDYLNLRQSPSADSKVLGRIPPTASGLIYQGKSYRAGNTLWLQVQFGGIVGFASADFLAGDIGTKVPAASETAIDHSWKSLPADFQRFFESMWQKQQRNDARSSASDYASVVEYCYGESGRASRPEIERKLGEFNRRFPARSYRFEGINQIRIVAPEDIELTYTQRYSYEANPTLSLGGKTGRTKISLKALKTNEGWRIVRWEEKVTRDP